MANSCRYNFQLGSANGYKTHLTAPACCLVPHGKPSNTLHSHPSELHPTPLPHIMHPAGLSVFDREVLTKGLFWQICVLVILLLLLCEYAVRWWTTERDDMPVSLNSLSISTIVPFVRNRYDFLNHGFQNTGQTVFRFQLLNVRHVLSTSVTFLTLFQ